MDPDRPRRSGEGLTGADRASRLSAVGVSLLRALREPVIVVLVLAGIFDILSGDPVVHGTGLFAVALALAWDAIRRRRAEHLAPGEAIGSTEGQVRADEDVALMASLPPARIARELRLTPVVVLGALAYLVIVGAFARYSWPATIAVAVPAAAGVAVAWRGPLNAGPHRAKLDPLGAIVWAALFLVLALWELANLLLQPSLTTDSYAHPTFSVLMDPVLASHAGRSLFLTLWLAFGWYLVQR